MASCHRNSKALSAYALVICIFYVIPYEVLLSEKFTLSSNLLGIISILRTLPGGRK